MLIGQIDILRAAEVMLGGLMDIYVKGSGGYGVEEVTLGGLRHRYVKGSGGYELTTINKTQLRFLAHAVFIRKRALTSYKSNKACQYKDTYT